MRRAPLLWLAMSNKSSWRCVRLLLFFSPWLPASLCGGEIRILSQAVGTNAVLLKFHCATDAYYQIMAAGSLEAGEWAVTNMGLGSFLDVSWTGSFPQTIQYFRVRSAPRSAARDEDNDGLDDVFELSRQGFDPLNASDALRDTDEDGMPDGWEIQNQLDPFDASGMNGALGDPDEDGLANGNEWQRGYLPRVVDWPCVIYVDSLIGNDLSGTGRQEAPFRTIQRGVNQAQGYGAGVIRPAAGTYTETLNMGDNIILSANENVIVQGDIKLSGLTNVQIQGVTIEGGGLDIQHSIAQMNRCEAQELRMQDSRLVVSNSLLTQIKQYGGFLDLANSKVAGGDRGVQIEDGGEANIHHCMIEEHSLYGCFAAAGCSVRVWNTVLARNREGLYLAATASGELIHDVLVYNELGGVVGEAKAENVTVSHCVLWRNGAEVGISGARVEYCAFQSIPTTVDPNVNFVVEDPLWVNIALDNYHIQADSPLIDQGGFCEGADIDGESRPSGGACDIGIDEFIDEDQDEMPTAWENQYGVTAATADEDQDGRLNMDEYREGRNPLVADPPIVVTVTCGVELQPAIDAVWRQGGGTVLASPNSLIWWPEPAILRDNVTLQGAGPDSTMIREGVSAVRCYHAKIEGIKTPSPLRIYQSDNISVHNVEVQSMVHVWDSAFVNIDHLQMLGAGGMWLWWCPNMTLRNSTISDCSGGISVSPTPALFIENLISTRNGYGFEFISAINAPTSSISIQHSIFAYNRGAGIRGAGDSSVSISNSILWHNGDDLQSIPSDRISHCNISDEPIPGGNNLYAVWPAWENPAANNYHLRSSSALRNKGFNLRGRDMDNEIRPPVGMSVVDIGPDQAYFGAGNMIPSWWVTKYGRPLHLGGFGWRRAIQL